MPDETIALGPWGRGQGTPGGGGLFGNQSPFQMMGDVMRLRQTQQEWNARGAFGDIMASSPDLSTALERARQDPMVSAWAPQLMTELRNQQLLDVQVRGQNIANAKNGYDLLIKSAMNAGNDPSALVPAIQAGLAGMDPRVQKDILPMAMQWAKGMVGDLHGTPEEQSAQYQKNRAQWMIANNVTPDAAYQSAAGTVAPQVHVGPFGPGGAQTPVIIGGVPGQGQSAPGGGLPMATPAGGGGGGTTGGATSPSGMPMGPSKTQETYLTHRGEDMANYQGNLDKSVQSGSQIMQTINEANEALQHFKAGAGAEARVGIAQLFQALGADPKLYNRIVGGDLSAAQEMQKLMVNTTWGQIKEQMPSASRSTQMEFQTFMKNNPNINLDPGAIQKIFNFWMKSYARDRIEQRELGKHLKSGGDISDWPQKWTEMAGKMGLRDAIIKSPTGKVIHPGAINQLLDNPDTAADFDGQFGAGSAARYLGQ